MDETVLSWARGVAKGNSSSTDGLYSTTRRNTRHSAQIWRQQLEFSLIMQVQEACQDFMVHAGYPMVHTKQQLHDLDHFLLEAKDLNSRSEAKTALWWKVRYLAPSQYLNQCWIIVCWMTRTILDKISISMYKCFLKNSFRYFVCKMSAVWFRPQYVNNNEAVVHPVVRAQLKTLQWRHNDHDGVSIHQPRGCSLNRLFSRRSKKTSKLNGDRWIPRAKDQ